MIGRRYETAVRLSVRHWKRFHWKSVLNMHDSQKMFAKHVSSWTPSYPPITYYKKNKGCCKSCSRRHQVIKQLTNKRVRQINHSLIIPSGKAYKKIFPKYYWDWH